MEMDFATWFMLGLAVVMVGTVVTRHPDRVGDMLRQLMDQGGAMVLRVPLALLAASFISELVPTKVIGAILGAESGAKGVFLACILGGLIPGGPMISFPIAIVIWQMGAGQVQMVTFLASWSIFAVHRIISYELPIMGPRFVAVRLASSWMLPPLTGLIAFVILSALSF
ncbi:hypothetical protein M8R20_19805 [Pseudomonas sp. R2.Fl]|nr:hypothetical protein [Pseudomonas sp. R2.Fl]